MSLHDELVERLGGPLYDEVGTALCDAIAIYHRSGRWTNDEGDPIIARIADAFKSTSASE